jgi:glucokinase-like ROK family protein
MASPNALIGSKSSTVKSHNLRAVLFMLRQHERVSRVRLARLTGLSTTTITNLISELIELGIVVEEGIEEPEQRRGAGRPRTALQLVPDARFAVGIHFGVGSIRIGVANLNARLLKELSLHHPLEKSPNQVLTETAALTQEAIAASGVNPQQIVGLGVGASGLVDPLTGVNLVAPNLGWRNVPLQERFTERLGLPVCVNNNVRAMALGEAMFGVGRNVRALAFVYARVGVGAGFVVDGQLYHGSSAGAGEIGHATIIAEGGEPCRCGNTGCLETLVSEPAIVRLAEGLARRDERSMLATQLERGEGTTIERVFAAARAGDSATQLMLDERACYMGIALANLINILNPELIVLGGIYAQGWNLLFPTIEATMRQRAFANLGERVRLEPTSFGRQAGVVGAATLALSTFFYDQPDRIY